LDNSGATAGVCTGKAKPKPVYVGARPRTELILFFNGLIDDVRIYDRALSAAEVWQLYQQGVD
jgi:hypothetical protein